MANYGIVIGVNDYANVPSFKEVGWIATRAEPDAGRNTRSPSHVG